MHRDYANPGGDVAVAVFDDRIEISSLGRLPGGVTAEMLSGPHPSILRNPLIAQTFHRTGAVEVWGRGTNRVVDECARYGVNPPEFEERGGSVLVTFRAQIGHAGDMVPPRDHVGTKTGLSRDQASVLEACLKSRSITELMSVCDRTNRTKFRDQILRPLLDAAFLEMTIPEKPRSSKQQYRITAMGRRVTQQRGQGS